MLFRYSNVYYLHEQRAGLINVLIANDVRFQKLNNSIWLWYEMSVPDNQLTFDVQQDVINESNNITRVSNVWFPDMIMRVFVK
jgi:hypothetical protein